MENTKQSVQLIQLINTLICSSFVWTEWFGYAMPQTQRFNHRIGFEIKSWIESNAVERNQDEYLKLKIAPTVANSLLFNIISLYIWT